MFETKVDRLALPEAFTTAAVAATAFAPSILNTQPWRWQVHDDRIELYADRARQLATDPDGRLLMLSWVPPWTMLVSL